MNNLIIDKEFEKLPEHVRGRMIREADSVSYSPTFFPGDNYSPPKTNSPLTPTKERYKKIAVSSNDLRHIQELLYHRMHTARKILEHNTDNPMREMFVKYLEMIEQQIKKALILE